MFTLPRQLAAYAIIGSTFALAQATTQPAAAPLKIPPSIQRMSDAYRKLKSLSVAGTLDLQADISGEKDSRHADFTASYTSPLRFKHEIKQDVVVADTGDKVYLFLPTTNIYTVTDAPASPAKFSDFSDDVRGVLESQDLSLALALSENPTQELLSDATAIAPAADVTIAGKAYPAVAITWADRDMTVVLDPATHLLRRTITDESRGLRLRGADVKTALITLDYATTTPDAAVKPEELAFTPPPTAQEQRAESSSALALVGKPAPHFTLKELDGTEVSDAKLQGKVYILDFWATWCGPCVASLPGLDEIYKTNKDKGLSVFAVNQQEDPAKVKAFIGTTQLSVPVLMDTDRAVGTAYGADAIPETVLVGKDGTVRKVFIGSGNEKNISAAVEEALHP